MERAFSSFLPFFKKKSGPGRRSTTIFDNYGTLTSTSTELPNSASFVMFSGQDCRADLILVAFICKIVKMMRRKANLLEVYDSPHHHYLPMVSALALSCSWSGYVCASVPLCHACASIRTNPEGDNFFRAVSCSLMRHDIC